MRRATPPSRVDDHAHEIVCRHIGARRVPADLQQQVEWAVAERLHDELQPALDESLAQLLETGWASRSGSTTSESPLA
jgi:hypothetical protein